MFRLIHPLFFEIICLSDDRITIIRYGNKKIVGKGKMDEKNHEEGIELKINFFDQPIMVRIGDNDFRYGLGNQQLNIELWSTNCNI